MNEVSPFTAKETNTLKTYLDKDIYQALCATVGILKNKQEYDYRFVLNDSIDANEYCRLKDVVLDFAKAAEESFHYYDWLSVNYIFHGLIMDGKVYKYACAPIAILTSSPEFCEYKPVPICTQISEPFGRRYYVDMNGKRHSDTSEFGLAAYTPSNFEQLTKLCNDYSKMCRARFEDRRSFLDRFKRFVPTTKKAFAEQYNGRCDIFYVDYCSGEPVLIFESVVGVKNGKCFNENGETIKAQMTKYVIEKGLDFQSIAEKIRSEHELSKSIDLAYHDAYEAFKRNWRNTLRSDLYFDLIGHIPAYETVG